MDSLLDIQNIGPISIIDFFIGLFELLSISFIFRFFYEKYSTSVSNRKIFSYQFIPFSVSIYLIVFTIKGSIVLSLGLVGALSIIRFRTAIKETEQIIALLFLTGISISLAANQFILALISSIIIFIFYFIRASVFKSDEKEENIIVSKINNFDESEFQILINKIKTELNINISVISLEQSKNECNIIIKLSEVNLDTIKRYRTILNSTKMSLVELNMY